MNYSTAVMLINTNIRAIATSYEVDRDGKGVRPYTIYKTLDHTIKPGDYVVVPTDTRHNQTVVRVEEVDVDIDFESPKEIKWIIDRVALADHDRIIAEEKQWVEQIKAAEKRRKREELKKSMLDMYQDDGIEKLPIAHMADIRAIEAKGGEDV